MKIETISSAVRAPYIATRQPMARRRFLRGAGVALSLPLLDVMMPRFARAQAASTSAGGIPRRLFGIMNNIGYLTYNYFSMGGGP